MTRRFRLIAGPNGSGKSTLTEGLARDYAVNFYTRLNADVLFAELRRTLATQAPFPLEDAALRAYAAGSEYAEAEKARFADGRIRVDGDTIRFAAADDVNSYTAALVTNFLQDECIVRGVSFSQETVFSHPSKVAALAKAKASGYRTYLYFVALDDPRINAARVASRYAQGGHDVPPEKIAARYVRSLANVRAALPHLSRAFFFDNAGEMRFLAGWSAEDGFAVQAGAGLPNWFLKYVYDPLEKEGVKA